MKAFVTGGAGFIGSHLVSRLLESEKTEKLVVYDNFTSGRRGYLEVLTRDRRLSVVEGDLKDAERVREVMNGCDTNFHLAPNPDIAKAITQPDIDFWQSTYLTENVLEAMRQTGASRIFYLRQRRLRRGPGRRFSEELGTMYSNFDLRSK
jgi:UDP-glucose 4-epimerase